jgi:predicted lipoprotein with Yx(FWY)xxD motif
MRIPWLLLALTVPLLLVFAVACGDDDDDGGDATATATESSAEPTAADDETATPTEEAEEPTATAEPTDEPAGGEDVVAVGSVDGVGDVLVDAEGFTLYIFTNDGENSSSCSGACATTWPPLTTDATEIATPDGVTGAFTVFDRGDGTMQVAFDGMPLYRYAPDTAPGQANGEGVGGVWFVVRIAEDAAAGGGGGGDAALATEPDYGY